ncbi:MAG TPA: GDSL-type esterase/lipase family protein [Polyangiaceae bacterium]|nr:GDSL-type esterase/lipase family protein [Polyangiaceae bacterium]
MTHVFIAMTVTSVWLCVACGGGQSGPRPAPTSVGNTASGGGAVTVGGGGAASSGAAQSGGGVMSAGGGAAAGGGGVVNVTPTTLADGAVSAADPHLRFYGRWDLSDPAHPAASWGPVAIRLRFESRAIALDLMDDAVDLGDEGKGNAYQFRIDDGDFQRLGPGVLPGMQLASELSPGAHEVLLVRRTESKWGKTRFGGFKLDAGAHLLDPPSEPTRRIEVFGDSISAGLANENTGPYTNATENGYLAFGPTLARKLDAEWRVEARGGGSFYNDFYLPMVPFFERTYGPENKQNAPAADNPPWRFEPWQPDLLVVALGTNDFSEQYPHIEQAAYVSKHQAFLRTLRGHYPHTEIVCLAPFKPGAPWDEARSYIAASVADLGDAHIHAVDPTTPSAWLTFPDDYVSGDAFHPNIAGHEKIATELALVAKAALGW